MAKMVPDLPAQMIQNDGERMFYLACRDLPDEYTVFYATSTGWKSRTVVRIFRLSARPISWWSIRN